MCLLFPPLDCDLNTRRGNPRDYGNIGSSVSKTSSESRVEKTRSLCKCSSLSTTEGAKEFFSTVDEVKFIALKYLYISMYFQILPHAFH